MVTVLTSTGNGPLDVGRMPRADTGDLSKTLMCLSRKLLGSPSAGDARETVALGDGDGINNLILLKDGVDLDGLLKEAIAEGNLICHASTVDLDLHQVSLLLLERSLADLSVSEDTDDCSVLLDTFELSGDGGALVL